MYDVRTLDSVHVRFGRFVERNDGVTPTIPCQSVDQIDKAVFESSHIEAEDDMQNQRRLRRARFHFELAVVSSRDRGFAISDAKVSSASDELALSSLSGV